jgi:aspartate racemase
MSEFAARRWSAVAKLLLASAERLKLAGAQLLICPDNTVHEAFGHLPPGSPLPWLHIAEEVAAVAARHGYQQLGILGTRSLMEGPVYPQKLAQLGMAHTVPRLESRKQIDTIIFDELVHGQVTDPARACVSRVISDLGNQGCDAVVLGCTELPLLIRPKDSSLPILDSTRLLALAALNWAVEGAAPRLTTSKGSGHGVPPMLRLL